MFKFGRIILLAGFLAASAWQILAQSPDRPAFIPKWNVGDRWILEATYRDLKSPGEVWLPPIRWVFHVKSVKNIDRQDCYAIHIYSKNRSVKAQAILYLSTIDLHPMRVIDIYSTPSGMKNSERDIDTLHPSPLLSEGALIPYDMPIFPLQKKSVQGADGMKAYRAPKAKSFDKIRRIGGFSFKKTVQQSENVPTRQQADAFRAYKTGGEAFKVELFDSRSKENLTQLWGEGAPWALSSETPARKVKLIPSSAPSPLPENTTGGDK